MICFLKKIYFLLGIHSAPKNTLCFYIHKITLYIYRSICFKKKLFLNNKKKFDLKYLDNALSLKDINEVRSILVVKGDHIGDLVLSLNSIEKLKNHFKNAKLTLICNECNKDIAISTGLFHAIVNAPIDLNRFGPTKQGLIETLEIIKKLPTYDIAIDLKVEGVTRFILKAVNSKLKAGFYCKEMKNMGNAIVLPFVDLDTTLHNHELLDMLVDAVIKKFTTYSTAYSLKKITDRNSIDLSNFKKPLIGIGTGAGSSIRIWPHYIDLVLKLHENFQADIILFGCKDQNETNKLIEEKYKKLNFIHNFTDKLSLTEFTNCASKLDLFIGNDTGTTHIASQCETPTICIFSGAGLYQRFSPIGKKTTVIRLNEPCSPCFLKEIKECTLHHKCMKNITVEHVLNAAKKLLSLG